MKALYAALVAIVTVATPVISNAAAIIIGPFCMDGIKDTPRPDEQTTTADGTWTPHQYDFKRSSSKTEARLLIFDKVIPKAVVLETCSDVVKRMKAAGSETILSGSLNFVDVRGNIFVANVGENRFQIHPGKLDIEFG